MIDTECALKHYIATALWSTINIDDNEDEYLDASYSIDDFDHNTLEAINNELLDFINKYYHLVSKNDKDKRVDLFAHNFWLTRNGHGAGFWDGDYENGDALTEACADYGEIYLYIGDDNKIYAQGLRDDYRQ